MTTYASGAAKPNIVLIVSDDAGYNSFGFSAALLGREARSETPNLDALAAQSMVLKQGYVADGLCSTSRAGLLTGQYAQRYGFEDNIMGGLNVISTAGNQGLSDQQITIAQRLKGLGYSTGAIGKWHLGYADGYNRPLDKGFDEFFGFFGGARQYFGAGGDESSMRRGDANIEAQWRTEGDKSKYDPVNGRYVTDAFGEEAVSFINHHSDDANPFFLYLAFNAPHSPWGAKQADLDHFSNISDPTRRLEAAMNYALDRSIGDVMTALEANGVDDNTIVVFMNDNGPAPPVYNEGDSAPLRGYKGSSTEGGLRVPFLVRAPGLQPGTYDKPVDAHDIAPTLYNAAGGDVSQIAADGHDVMPFLKGEATEDPNTVRFWRSFDTWAVRRGDWKLTLPYRPNAPGKFLFNIALNPQENVYYGPSRPDLVAELTRELTNWEATLAKPKWGSLGTLDQNAFDHFVFRNNLSSTTNWSTANNWQQGGTANIATLKPQDAYANAIIEFGTRNDADYTATNDMKRLSRETFMLNELRLSGSFNGLSNRQGLINGNAVLFVKSLDGQLPRINLTATASGGSQRFAFRVDTEVQLLHNLEITGNGTQNFVIGGAIRDYYDSAMPSLTSPHSVRKLGTSKVTLSGNNTFAGSMTVSAGEVVVDGPSAAINGATSITVEQGAAFTLQSGLVKTPTLNVAPDGQFAVNGGLLETKTIIGSLVLNQGTFAPGLGTTISTISDSFVQNGGKVQLQLGGTTPGTSFDQLQIDDAAVIAGGLQVLFAPGFTPSLYQTFEIVTAGNIIGTFSSHELPTLPSGLTWRVLYTTHGISLAVRPPGQSNTIIPTGDYNLNGKVDAADYSVWRDSLGSTSALDADGNGDHVVDNLDYEVWKSHMGQSFTGMAGDFNSNGTVDAADYSIWRDGLGSKFTVDNFSLWKESFRNEHYGSGLGADVPSFGQVPEPSALFYLMMGEIVLECTDLGRIARKAIKRAFDA
ncbi:MAG: sulfatase-like hydrolase/transferase [Pirellulales bacterium]